MLQYVVRCNNYTSMDRVYLEAWLINHAIEYTLGRFGDFLAFMTVEQAYELQSDGWEVLVL